MKYMTKEWYETMQQTNLDCLIKISKEAEAFSESYYQKAYYKREQQWIRVKRKAAEIERKLAQEDMPFDEKMVKRWFRAMTQEYIRYYNRILPDEILSKVADVRVLALGYASKEVKKALAALSDENEKKVKAVFQAYQKEYQQTFGDAPPAFAQRFCLHDCRVLSCRKRGKDVVLQLDSSGGFTDVTKLVFENGEVLLRERPLAGSWWLNDEIYLVDSGYQIHALLERNGDTIYFIVNAKNVLLS